MGLSSTGKETLTVVSKIRSKMEEGPMGTGCSLERSRQMIAVGYIDLLTSVS